MARRSMISAGYRILYGRNSDDLDNSVLVDDPATDFLRVLHAFERHLVLRGGRRECERPRRPADHGRFEVHLTSIFLFSERVP